MGTTVMAVIAGGLVADVLMWVIRQRGVSALIRTLGDADHCIVDLSTGLTKHTAQIETGMREAAVLETTIDQMRDAIADQLEVIEQLRTELQSTAAAKEHWANHAGQIAKETVRLCGLTLTFERWHEQMISFIEQNHDMRARNGKLQSIVRHVVIVSLNASIEMARAGTADRGFAVMASEVRTLTTRSEELSKSYRSSLHLNNLTTTATFQDIQAGGKMITVSLLNVKVSAGQFQHQLHQTGLT